MSCEAASNLIFVGEREKTSHRVPQLVFVLFTLVCNIFFSIFSIPFYRLLNVSISFRAFLYDALFWTEGKTFKMHFIALLVEGSCISDDLTEVTFTRAADLKVMDQIIYYYASYIIWLRPLLYWSHPVHET